MDFDIVKLSFRCYNYHSIKVWEHREKNCGGEK